jgi:multiple sugar transport system substrate-binding protein
LEEPQFFPEFRSRHHFDVRVSRMNWDEAWPKLLNYALYGGGPHISLIGSIWTSTLAAMHALRPISAGEVESLGGTRAFFAPTWQNAMLAEGGEAWAVPLTGFTYIVLYRRDLLERAGIAEQTAFESADAMLETLARLRGAGISSPLVLPSGSPHRARVHIAASWIWGAGGDFMSHDGRRVLFDGPEVRTGLNRFFQLYRHLSPADLNLSYGECLDRFARGQAAVTIASSSAPAIIRNTNMPQVMSNFGAAVVPGVPWVGGSNLVIWREAQLSREQERAVLLLVNFLADSATQVRYAYACDVIPARVEALPQVRFEPEVLNEVFQRSLDRGRAYRPAPIWVRMVSDLSRALDAVTADVLGDAMSDIDRSLSKRLGSLAQRFNLMLAG